MKSGNEGILNDEGKSEIVIEEAESRKERINQCYGKCSLGGDIVKGEKGDIGECKLITIMMTIQMLLKFKIII